MIEERKEGHCRVQVRNDGGLDQEQAVEMERGAETWDMFSRKNRGDRGIDLM